MRKEFTLTKEQIKAIRVVLGWDPDLRIKYSKSTKELRDLIRNYSVNLFGLPFFDVESESQENMIAESVYSVLRGMECKKNLKMKEL